MSALAEAYRAVSAGVGLIDRSNRARVEVSGPDRVKFLHNVTTNDVKRLPAGRGHEPCRQLVEFPAHYRVVVVAAGVSGDGAGWLRSAVVERHDERGPHARIGTARIAAQLGARAAEIAHLSRKAGVKP